MSEKPAPVAVHDELGPSQFGRAAICPGSVPLARGMPDISSPEADEGTRLHAEVARCIREADDPAGEESELVRQCVEFLSQWTEGVDDAHLELGLELQWPWKNYRPLRGTADFVGIAKDKVVLVDWKFGRNEVPPQMVSYQLAIYGLMAMQRFKRPAVEAHVFQPRLDFHATAAYAGEEPALWDDLKRVYDQVYADAMVLRPGPHCQHCKAVPTCPALARVVNEAMLTDRFGLGGAELAAAMDKAKLADKWAGDVLFYGKSLLLKGEPVPGWTIKKRAGNRHFTALPIAFEKLKDVIKIEEFLSLADVSVTKCEDLWVTRVAEAKKLTKKDTKAAFAKHLVGIIDRASDQLILTKETEDE